MDKIKHQLLYWFPVYTYAILIFYFSSLHDTYAYAPYALKYIFIGISFSSYVLHIIEYMIFGFLLYRALLNSNFNNPLSLAVVIAIIYGITDEIHQLFVPHRAFSLLDILSNSFGAISLQSILYIKKELLNQKS